LRLNVLGVGCSALWFGGVNLLHAPWPVPHIWGSFSTNNGRQPGVGALTLAVNIMSYLLLCACHCHTQTNNLRGSCQCTVLP